MSSSNDVFKRARQRPVEISRRNMLSATAVGVSAAMGLSACGGSEDGSGEYRNVGFEDCEENPTSCNTGERADGGTITWAVDGEWIGWNRYSAEDSSTYLSQVLSPAFIHDGLGTFDQNGEFVYDDSILKADPELVSENPMQVKYTLNPDANWGDGNPIVLDDWIYHWYAHSSDPAHTAESLSASTAWGDTVASVEEPEPGTILVTYKDGVADPEWAVANTFNGSHPTHVLAVNGFTDWKTDPQSMADSFGFFTTTIPTWSTGPYKITEAVAGEYVFYEPNADWAGSAETTLDKLEFKVIPDFASILTELRQGTIHGASPVSSDADSVANLESTAEADGIRYSIAPGPSWSHLDFNTARVTDVVLRQAVFTCLDVQDMIDRTGGLMMDGLKPKGNHLFRGDSEYYEDYVTVSGQGSGDIEAAKALLEGAGYTWDEAGALLDPSGAAVQIRYRYADTVNSITFSEIAQANCAELGVELTLEQIPDGELGSVLSSGDFDLMGFSWSGSPTIAGTGEQYWKSDSDSNYGKLNDPVLDELLAQISTSFDPAEAAAAANAAVEQVVKDAYVLPITDNPVVIMVSEKLVNVRDNWATSLRATYNTAEWGLAAS